MLENRIFCRMLIFSNTIFTYYLMCQPLDLEEEENKHTQQQICFLLTLTKNIVKCQLERISAQVPNSAYITDKNKCVTRM